MKISRTSVKRSLIDQLEQKNIKTEYTLSAVDTYMASWEIVQELEADIKKRGAICESTTCKGDAVMKANESIKMRQNELAAMLKITQMYGLQSPIIKGSNDDYL